MMIAAVGDGLYNLFLLGHLVSFLVAFAPAVVHPVLAAETTRDGDQGAQLRLAGHMAANGRRIHFPALLVAGAFGLAMVLASAEAWDFTQTWVSLAFLVWLAMCGVVSGLLLPNERKVAAGDGAAQRLVDRGGQIVTLLLVVMLYLMVWKPGI